VAETYDMVLDIKIVHGVNKEVVVDEAVYLNSLAFGAMVEKAADYYALVTKLQKK